MFTRLQFKAPTYTGDARTDYENLTKAIIDFQTDLNRKGSLTIDEAGITASQGIIFPATQVPSSNVNTLDDYEEATTFAPTFSFATPGDLIYAASVAVGDATKIGRLVSAQFAIATSAFAHTTAAGDLIISGFPYTVSNASSRIFRGSLSQWRGITKATYTQMAVAMVAGGTTANIAASGSGVASANVTAADMPTGGTVFLFGSVEYIV